MKTGRFLCRIHERWHAADSIPLYLYAGFQCLYGIFAFRYFPLVGDAGDYAALISHGTFHLRTLHVGFYVIYYPLYLLNEAVFGISSCLFLNLLSSVFGAVSVSLLYLVLRSRLAGETSRRIQVAAYAAYIYGFSGLVWYHSEFLEVQALMIFLLFAALLLFLRRRFAFAGICLATSALVSQACAPVGIWFLALAVKRRVGMKKIVLFGISFLATLTIGILPVFDDYFWGPRGVISAHGVFAAAPLWKTPFTFGYTLLESFWLLFPLLPLAVPHIRRESNLLWLSLASIPGFLYVGPKLGHVEYGYVWMPLFFLVAAYLAIALDSIIARVPRPVKLSVTGILGFLFFITTLIGYILPKSNASEKADACLERVYEQSGTGHLIAPAYTGFVYAHKFWPQLSDVWDAPWSMWHSVDGEGYRELASLREVYVFDYIPPSHFLRRALLSNAIAKRFIPEKRRFQFLEEFGPISNDIRTVVGTNTLEPVLSCQDAVLWRLSFDGIEEVP